MSRKWKIISLSLCLTNLLALQWLLHINEERSHAEEWLGQLKWGEGLREAEKDFRAGNVRVYSMEVTPYPGIGQPIHHLTNTFTGRKDGPFEIWAWRCYQPKDKLTLRIWQERLDGYNGRMSNLFRKPYLPDATNAHSAKEIPGTERSSDTK